MTTLEAIKVRIMDLCNKNNITPNKLGRLAGLDPSTITSIFYGKSKNPGITTIQAICDGLEMTIYDFFNDPLFQTRELEY